MIFNALTPKNVREMRFYVTIVETEKWQIPKLFVSSQCDEPLHTIRENISSFCIRLTNG